MKTELKKYPPKQCYYCVHYDCCDLSVSSKCGNWKDEEEIKPVHRSWTLSEDVKANIFMPKSTTQFFTDGTLNPLISVEGKIIFHMPCMQYITEKVLDENGEVVGYDVIFKLRKAQ